MKKVYQVERVHDEIIVKPINECCCLDSLADNLVEGKGIYVGDLELIKPTVADVKPETNSYEDIETFNVTLRNMLDKYEVDADKVEHVAQVSEYVLNAFLDGAAFPSIYALHMLSNICTYLTDAVTLNTAWALQDIEHSDIKNPIKKFAYYYRVITGSSAGHLSKRFNCDWESFEDNNCNTSDSILRRLGTSRDAVFSLHKVSNYEYISTIAGLVRKEFNI